MSTILVTGAGGHFGGEVVRQLLAKNSGHRIIAQTRDAAKVSELQAAGAEVRVADFGDYASLLKAFAGVDKLLLVSTDGLGDRAQVQAQAVDAAKEAGVGRVFYTSAASKAFGTDSPIALIAGAHEATEKKLVESGLPYTFLRNDLYAEYLPVFLGPQVVETGTVYLPMGTAAVAAASRKDMAEATAHLLLSDETENRIYEIAGEETYTFEDIAGWISERTGKPVTYVSPTHAEYETVLRGAGLPDMAVAVSAGFVRAMAEGRFAQPDPTLRQLLNRPLTPLKDIIAEAYPN